MEIAFPLGALVLLIVILGAKVGFAAWGQVIGLRRRVERLEQRCAVLSQAADLSAQTHSSH